MEQATFSELEHDSKKRRTRREIFLEKMDRLIPWERLEEPHRAVLPEAGPRAAGRTPCRRCCACTACSCSTT